MLFGMPQEVFFVRFFGWLTVIWLLLFVLNVFIEACKENPQELHFTIMFDKATGQLATVLGSIPLVLGVLIGDIFWHFKRK